MLTCTRRESNPDRVEPWGPMPKDVMQVQGEIGRYGGRLVIPINQEPRSFNRIVASDTATADLTDRIFADLIHINRETQRPEPALAKSWEFSPDRNKLVVHLREGVRFSDGESFTADDVLFTFKVVYDPKVNSPQADQLKVDGKPFVLRKLDHSTVQFEFASPLGDIERVFDSIFILPKHKLESVYQSGQFASAWNISTQPAEIVGLGPFKVSRYVPGQRVELERNPNYWKVDSKNERLPYLSQLILQIIPDRNNQFLSFQSGTVDILNEVRAEDFAVLQKEPSTKGITVRDLGTSLTSEQLWFNQNRGVNSKSHRPFLEPTKLKWFTNQKFRQAISYAIDRKSMINLVFAGRATEAYGLLSPSNQAWYNPGIHQYPYDVETAKKLLIESGFHFATVNGRLELQDASNHPVRFSLITNTGNRIREKLGTLIQSDLEKIGIHVDFTPLEFNALIAKISETFDYDACLLGAGHADTDPSSQMNVWLSSAPNHQWFPNQKKPATPWEARIDELLQKQSRALRFDERRKYFAEVQGIVSEELPFIYLVSRNVLVAAKGQVGNFRPTILDHHTLWNSEQLYLK